MTSSCPLTAAEQRRNLILFALCIGLEYLAAPVLYVGITQASLCDHLGADTLTANLPAMLYFAMTAVPTLVAWASPSVRVLQRNLAICFGLTALTLGLTALALHRDVSRDFKLWAVILQGAVSGATMTGAIAYLWEIIGRGSDEKHRGAALSLAFGMGPVLAVLGSLGQTALLGGTIFGWQFAGVGSPQSFVALYGLGVPIMILGTILACFFVVPPVADEPSREPVREVVGVLVGLPLMFASVLLVQGDWGTSAVWLRVLGYLAALGATAGFVYHFRTILQQPVLLVATLVTILVYTANMIPSNMNLYSAEVLGDLPEKYAGQQNMLRFGFKVAAGLFLGWLLTRTHPRAGVLATASLYLAAMLWATLVTGPWYLVAFGLYGAGELIGVYAPNYIVSASRPSELRRNMAFVSLLMVPAAPAGYLFGAVADLAIRNQWTGLGWTSRQLGFRISFLACAACVLLGMLIARALLPKHPQPPADVPANSPPNASR